MMNRSLFGALALLFVVTPGDALARTKKPPPAPPPVEAPPAPAPDPLAQRPEIAAPRPFAPPTPDVTRLGNGVPVWVVANASLPIFSLVLSLEGGSQLDPKGKEGTASLALDMLTRGAGGRTGAEFAAEVERRGLDISFAAGPDGSAISLSGPIDELGPGLDLLADMVFRPTWDKTEFPKARELRTTGLTASLDEPAYVAARTANALYWGAAHPYGRPADGTQAGLKKLGVGDLKKWHKTAFNASGARFVAAGAVTAPMLQAELEKRFGQWKATPQKLPAVPAAPVHASAPIYIVDAPGASQTGFYLAFPGVAVGTPTMAATQAGSIVLGGTFTSRLNSLLREKRGYTYGVRAESSSARHGGTLVVRTRIRADVTAPALTDLKAELESIRQGITEDELKKAQGAFRQDVVAALETRNDTAHTYSSWAQVGLGPEAQGASLAAINGATLDAVKSAMAGYDASKAVFVLVGDRKVIEPQLREAGFTQLEFVTPP